MSGTSIIAQIFVPLRQTFINDPNEPYKDAHVPTGRTMSIIQKMPGSLDSYQYTVKISVY